MTDESDNVIHVVFGSDGGYRISTPAGPNDEAPAPPVQVESRSGDPLADLYTTAEVARLFELTESRLRTWARQDFLAPSVKRGRRRFYTFQDLIGVRVAKGLLDAGVPARDVKLSVSAIRDALPKVIRPLAELRVVAEGRAMVVHDEHGGFEPLTGQRVIDFRVDALRADVVERLRPAPTDAARRNAYVAYLEGCRLDEDEATYADAEVAYREALRLDPTFVSAMTNLGNLRYRLGDEAGAILLYQKALALDPDQPEAHYNLGFIEFEKGHLSTALPYFEKAVALDPGFADAHFNLASVLDQTGRGAEARHHWQIYVELEPDSAWAELARERLR
ncbi:MAG: tetratricopeptide repeat protein [Deltaproteobacteria bacterium]|nr:tetratricopeptide repeat protein [Deltaproteobacteria bacterium]